MKLVIIRHGDPFYTIDSLTETGWKEAQLLSERISKLDVKAFYVSPLGRAQDTALATLRKMDRKAETLTWLQEFSPRITHHWADRQSCIWDWLPEDWANEPIFYDPDNWYKVPIFEEAGVEKEYKWVIQGFDELLAKHGVVVYEKNHASTLYGGNFSIENMYTTVRTIIPPEFLPEEYR